MRVQEAQIVKVQLAGDGQLWYSDGVENPVAVQDMSGFVSDLRRRDSLHVRVLGTPENAPLIVALYQQCCSPRRHGKLEVASPLVCETDSERKTPTVALYRMRQCLLSPSLGGWHQVDELDYPAYAIAAQLAKDGGFTDHAKRLLLTHPVYHDLTFLPTLDVEATASLLSLILDTRWFVDFRNPYRLSKLRMFLGLTPRYMRQVAAGAVNCERALRCRAALNAWKGHTSLMAVNTALPGNFLWRRRAYAGCGVKGDLRATQAFVTYLARTWQQQLVSKSNQELEMFVPESLLRGDEVDAYREHAARRKAV